MSFYVTLPSNNSATSTYSSNTTVLAEPINLEGKYEVALVQITYPVSIIINFGNLEIFNYFYDKFGYHTNLANPIKISLGSYRLRLDEKNLKDTIEEKINRRIHEEIAQKEYDFFQYIINNKFEVFSNIGNTITFIKYDQFYLMHKSDYNRISEEKTLARNFVKFNFEQFRHIHGKIKNKKILLLSYEKTPSITESGFRISDITHVLTTDNVVLQKPKFEIKDSEDHIEIKIKYENKEKEYIKFVVSGLLGNFLDNQSFEKHEMTLDKPYKIPYRAFQNHYMAIYCDIIQPQYFGNKITKILKVIPFNSNNQVHGISSYIDYPHYVPVLYNTINSITIELYDLQGHLMQFESGTEYTIVKLHFRKIE